MELRKSTDKIVVINLTKSDLDKLDKKLDKIMALIKKQNDLVLTIGSTTVGDINNN